MSARRRGAVVAAMVGSLVVAVLAAPAVGGGDVGAMESADGPEPAEQDLEAEQLQGYVRNREALGFPSTLSYVEQLRGSEDDVGSDKYDIPMTAEEEAEWNRRTRWQAAADERLIPAAKRHQDFAGLYFDNNMEDGKVVVLTTGAMSTMLNDLADVDPPLTQYLVVRQTDVTDDQLNEMAGDVLDSAEQYFPGITVYAVGVDTRGRGLFISVPEEQVDAAREKSATVSRAVGDIHIRVDVGKQQDVEGQACTDREHCTPLRAGVVIRRGSVGGAQCTMGFPIEYNGELEFTTAGHCSYGTRGNLWYHRGHESDRDGYIGSASSNLYRDFPTGHGVDLLRGSTFRWYTKEPYGELTYINRAIAPEHEMTVCASLGVTNDSRCRSIFAIVHYQDSGCDCSIEAVQVAQDWKSTGGDSGSPIKKRWTTSAVGSHGSPVYFAPLRLALDRWGATMWVP